MAELSPSRGGVCAVVLADPVRFQALASAVGDHTPRFLVEHQRCPDGCLSSCPTSRVRSRLVPGREAYTLCQKMGVVVIAQVSIRAF